MFSYQTLLQTKVKFQTCTAKVYQNALVTSDEGALLYTLQTCEVYMNHPVCLFVCLPLYQSAHISCLLKEFKW